MKAKLNYNVKSRKWNYFTAEGEPISPLPLRSKVGFDHTDYLIKNKLLTDMINKDSEKDDF